MSEFRVSSSQLESFITQAMVSLGLPPEDAQTVGHLMAEADMQGSDGHGVIRLVPYAKRILAGGMNLKPNIRVVQERTAMALIDGDNGMGHLVMKRATELAIQKARSSGIAWVGSRLSNHAGPASLYARMALQHDMIGLYFAVGNANHLPPWGGLDMLLSTNPIAAAIPSGKEVPIVLDMATTVAAYGKVKAKAQRGEMMPEGWMIDRQGKPLLDPTQSDKGFLLPIGGYKGYGLAVMIGLLAGALNNAAVGKGTIDFNAHHDLVTNTGQTIIAVDPSAFGDKEAFIRRVIDLVDDLKGSGTLPGVKEIRVPGEGAANTMAERRKRGIPLSPELQEALNGCAQECGIPVLQF